MIAIENREADVLTEVSRRILCGTAKLNGELINPTYMPTPPQIARLCDEVQHERYTTPRLVYEKPPIPEISDEERERRKAKVNAALATLTGRS